MKQLKEMCRTVWVEAWSRGKDVENVQAITVKTAETSFEQWWRRNIEVE